MLTILSIAVTLCILTSYAIPVHAQTTSITDLTYPTTALAGGQVDVSFTVIYSNPNYGTYALLIAGLYVQNNDTWDRYLPLSGELVSASPNTCHSQPPPSWAECVTYAVSGSGSEHLEFRLNLDTTGQICTGYTCTTDYAYTTGYNNIIAVAGFALTSDEADPYLLLDRSSEPFSINIKNTVTLSLSVPNGADASIDGVSQGTANVSIDVTPGNHLIAVPTVVNTVGGTRLRFDQWSDGSLDATRTMDLEADESLKATYVTQYYVTASSDALDFQSGWYDSGATVQFSLNPSSTNQVMVQLGAFNGWFNNGTLVTRSVNGSLTVYGPINLNVEWGPGNIPYIVIGIGVVITIGVFLLLRARQTRRTKGNTTEPVAELATNEPLTKTTVISTNKTTSTEEEAVSKDTPVTPVPLSPPPPVETFDIWYPILWLVLMLVVPYAMTVHGDTLLGGLIGVSLLIGAAVYVHYNSKKFQIGGDRSGITLLFAIVGLPLYAYDLYALKEKQQKVPVIQPPTSPVEANVKAEVDSATKKTATGELKSTKFCRECGANIPRDSTYCEECGTNLG